MVKQLFSRWQVEADCMAGNEKHCVNLSPSYYSPSYYYFYSSSSSSS